MSSDSDPKAASGTLIVEVPHWTAVVRVVDNYSRPAAQVSTPIEEGAGTQLRVIVQLSPGIYKVDVSLGLTVASEWAPVRSGKVTVIPVSRWSALRLQSSDAPGDAPGNVAGLWMAAAQQQSLTPTWTSAPGGTSRLFVFVHTPDASKYPDFAQGLALTAANGSTLTELRDASRSDMAVGWTAFVADLQAGSCFLRRKGPGEFDYWLPLHLCEGWETQVIMAGRRGPSLRSVTTYMARRGTGFHHDDEIAAATEAILLALTTERGMGAVLGSRRLHRMLRDENQNPWLGILAAHAMATIEREATDEHRDPSSVSYYDKGLKDEILQFLATTIGSHADVRALLLSDQASPAPFPVPPMLRMGFRRVQQHATQFAGTIPLGSFTDRLLDKQVANSAWSVCRTSTAAGDAEDAVRRIAFKSVRTRGTRKTRGIAATTLRSNFPPSAPIYGGAQERDATAGPPDLTEVLKDLSLIRAAQSMLREPVEALKDSIEVNPALELHNLIEGVDAKGLSANGGMSLARAEKVLDRLRTFDDKGGGEVEPATRAAIDYALRQWQQRGRKRQDAKPDLSRAPDLTIEECVSVLRSAATQLRAAPSSEVDITKERTGALAERMERLARALIRCSNVIVITDQHGQFLYGNGAFTTLMQFADPQRAEGPTKAWTTQVNALPLGPSINVTLPGTPERGWTVHRSAVRRTGRPDVVAYVNLAEDRGGRPVAVEMQNAVSKRMADVTLHASLIQYASPKRRAESLRHLEAIADDLANVLAI